MHYLLLLLLALGPPAHAALDNPITVDPITVYYVDGESFEDIKENVEMAITDRGMILSGTLHVQEMLDRTGDDLGFGPGPYLRAESLEFCSALISHKMIKIDPSNIGTCPFAIAVYTLRTQPKRVYVTYRTPTLAGDSEKVMGEIMVMLDGVVRDAIE